MNSRSPKDYPDSDEALHSLKLAGDMSDAGLRRGLYPRWFAAVMSLWAGLLAATVGMAVWPLLFIGGLIGYAQYRKKTGAWINEVQNQTQLIGVVAGGLLVGALFIGSYAGRFHFGLWWAPIAAGVVVATGLFVTTECAYGKLRRKTPREEMH